MADLLLHNDYWTTGITFLVGFLVGGMFIAACVKGWISWRQRFEPEKPQDDA